MDQWWKAIISFIYDIKHSLCICLVQCRGDEVETLISRQETTTNLFSVLKWHSVELDTTCTGVVRTRDHCSCTWQFETSFCFLLPNLKLADTTINGHLRKVWARGNFDLSCANFLGYSTTFILVLYFLFVFLLCLLRTTCTVVSLGSNWVTGACILLRMS